MAPFFIRRSYHFRTKEYFTSKPDTMNVLQICFSQSDSIMYILCIVPSYFVLYTLIQIIQYVFLYF